MKNIIKKIIKKIALLFPPIRWRYNNVQNTFAQVGQLRSELVNLQTENEQLNAYNETLKIPPSYPNLKQYDISHLVNGNTWYANYSSYDEFSSDKTIQEYLIKLKVLASDLPPNIKAYCGICKKVSIMHSSEHGVNESYGCQCSGMNSRMRAMYEFITVHYPSPNVEKVYICEAVTPAYRLYETYFGSEKIIGSEFFDENSVSGESYDYQGMKVMHQDCRALSFSDNEFDLMITQDVFEHIFDYKKALLEAFRIIKPGGSCIIRIPFRNDFFETQMLSRLDENGEIVHLIDPPEYHGDPLTGGTIAYWRHGWQFVQELYEAGFHDVKVHFYNNVYKGYFGVQSLIVATKNHRIG